jgi:carbamoyl-phosphate synthase (ammonia)
MGLSFPWVDKLLSTALSNFTRKGIFRKYGVEVFGNYLLTLLSTPKIDNFFRTDSTKSMRRLQSRYAVYNIEDAVEAARKIGYPLMIRSAFALGGLGSGICEDETMLRDMGKQGPITLGTNSCRKKYDWLEEVEYEVVRDSSDNCVTVCNMENFDPLGIHTGDSIVIAPSQTLSNEEYHVLRDTAIKVVPPPRDHWGVQHSIRPPS